jgi:outer membrane receptor protein involved in Fe transport
MKTVCYVIMATTAVTAASPAVAQTPEEIDRTVLTEPSASDAPTLGDTVATAQRREQRSQDVGISNKAFSGGQLTKLGVFSSRAPVAVTPGLRNPQSDSGLTPSFSLRGLLQGDFGGTQEIDHHCRLIAAGSLGSSESEFGLPSTYGAALRYKFGK